MLTDEIFEKYARLKVPRYTSYPTAPHFQQGFSEKTYRSWLAALDPDEPMSLYVHVPFCRRMCWYCGCNMKLAYRLELITDYVTSLLNEIDLVADAMPARMRVAYIHFGGGTPTVLAAEQLKSIMSRLKDRYTFIPQIEASIECDPRSVSQKIIEAIGTLGFKRVSFGVQEFDSTVQQAINRIQPVEQVKEAVLQFRAAGVSNVNFDLIYGLPKQTVDTLTTTIDLSLVLKPDRLALFGYAHVPWFATNQRKIKTGDLPDIAQRHAMFTAARRQLLSAGYRSIGLDHFAQPGDKLTAAAQAGTLHRNFQGYVHDSARTVIGLGPSSIGTTPSGYVQNNAETGAWSRSLQSGLLPISRGLGLLPDDKLRNAVIEDIMCSGKADLEATGRIFGQSSDWYQASKPRLETLKADGLLTLANGKLRLTDNGWPLARIVASAFDAYLMNTDRHAVAV